MPHPGQKTRKNPTDAKKIIGGKINSGVDKGRDSLIKSGSNIVNKIGKSAISKGGDRDLINMGTKYVIKNGSRLIREGAGKVKNFIHTEGRNAANKAIGYASSKIRETGNKIKDKWGSFTNSLKRKR